MFKAKVKADVLKTVLDAVQTLVDEAKIRITPDGIGLKAVDAAHVAMVDLSLAKSAFISFEATNLEMGVDLDKLKDILKLASSSDEIELSYAEANHNLVFKIGNLTRRMSLVDTTNMSDPSVPNLTLPSKVVLRASELQQGIKASEAVSDHVALVAEKNTFQLIADGDTDQVNLTLTGPSLVSIDSGEKSRSVFSLDYFSNMAKVVKGSEPLTLNLGTDYPVKLEFDIADGHGHITYLLAPRIESA